MHTGEATLNTGEATVALIARGEAAAVAGSEELQKSSKIHPFIARLLWVYGLCQPNLPQRLFSYSLQQRPRAQFWSNFWRENHRAIGRVGRPMDLSQAVAESKAASHAAAWMTWKFMGSRVGSLRKIEVSMKVLELITVSPFFWRVIIRGLEFSHKASTPKNL